MLKDTPWLTSHVLLAEKNHHSLIKGCQALSCQIPFCCLHCTFSVSLPRFMFPVLSFMFIPSIPLLSNSPTVFSLSLCDRGSLRSFTSKDVFVPPLLPSKDVSLCQTGACKRPVSVIHRAVRLIKTTAI